MRGNAITGYFVKRRNSKKNALAICCFVFFITLGSCMNEQPTAVIFDTDLSSDVDDVGAVALLHSLAQEGDAKILAMMVSSGDPWSTKCLKAINSFYGKPDIPVGVGFGIDSLNLRRFAK